MAQMILGIPVENGTKKSVLEKIKKYIGTTTEFVHIVSLNPEIMVEAVNNQVFNKIVRTAQVRITDGIGVVLAGRILGRPVGERLTGVELVEELVKYAAYAERPIMLIGGGDKIAEKLAKCYSSKYPSGRFLGVQGYKNKYKPTKEEDEKLFSIVAEMAPQIVFVSFGSPWSETWLYENRERLQGMVCASVGGAFDYLSDTVQRPPRVVRRIGMEWLWRLITQPWRWKRQLKLITFILLILRERFTGSYK